MKLKKIEIQGFKSFVDKTVIEFLDGVTSIVGPNGSGKSNIADAIRWVLGEQSVKSLRGSKMEDVIFSGTENRKKLGFAEVSIFIDNTDSALPVEYNEVVVSRRVYRTGESGYYINNTECRLKDILELFMDTGVGRDGYSIIGQGKIDEILSNKSEERRAIFEEASGIVKYRTRKDEANKKLENTNSNLIRVNDVLGEIEKNIDRLDEKAKVARKFLEYKEDLKKLDVVFFLKNIGENAQKLADLDSIISTFDHNLNIEEEVALEVEKAKLNIKERLEHTITEIENTQAKYYEIENESEKINSKINVANEKVSNTKLNIDRLKEEVLKDSENIELLKEDILKKIEKQESLDKSKERFEKELNEKEDELKNITENMDSTELEKEKLKQEIELLVEKKNELKLKISSGDATILANRKQIDGLINDDRQKLYQKDSSSALREDVNSNLVQKNSGLNKINNEVSKYEEEISKINSERDEIKAEESVLKQEIMTLKSRYNYLKNLEQENEGYLKSVKTVLEHAKNLQMKNVYGTVASNISVEEKYETAIEIALGGYLQNIIVETEDEAKKLIEYLKQNSYGRATFLPLNGLKKVAPENSNKYKGYKGFLGFATDLVKFNSRFQDAINLALGKTAVVDNVDNAIEMSRKTKNSFKIVTLSGELISQVGSISGGQSQHKTAALIGRNEKILQLKTEVEEKERQQVKFSERIGEIDSRSNEASVVLNELKQKQDEIKIEVVRLTENFNSIIKEIEKIEQSKQNSTELKSSLESHIEGLLKEIATAEEEIAKIDMQIDKNQAVVDEYARYNKEKEKNINFLNEDIVNLRISLSSFDESAIAIDEMKEKIELDISNFNNSIEKKNLQISEFEKEIESVTLQISEYTVDIESLQTFKQEYYKLSEKLRNDKQDCLKKQDELEVRMLESIRKIEKIKDERSKIENKKIKYDLEIENLKNKMWDDYELTVSSSRAFLETLSESEITELEKGISKRSDELRKKIKDLGEVDVASIEEYKSTKERFDFILTQKLDLEETKTKLENLIANMTSIMKQQFSAQFKIINKNFSETFKELFGGGKAELKLSDESNILESGIDIEVQPPGKKLQNMMLLSGGERALTAISLLFAILKMKAPPFCVLDEIEAALDDINVQRFADYIKKYSDNSQFVVITHRKGTMEAASSVYGVTMQEYGISKILSMKMT